MNSEHCDSDCNAVPFAKGELVGCDYIVQYRSLLLANDNTCGVFRTGDAARAWADRHPERVRGGYSVVSYLAPQPLNYTEDNS